MKRISVMVCYNCSALLALAAGRGPVCGHTVTGHAGRRGSPRQSGGEQQWTLKACLPQRQTNHSHCLGATTANELVSAPTWLRLTRRSLQHMYMDSGNSGYIIFLTLQMRMALKATQGTKTTAACQCGRTAAGVPAEGVFCGVSAARHLH